MKKLLLFFVLMPLSVLSYGHVTKTSENTRFVDTPPTKISVEILELCNPSKLPNPTKKVTPIVNHEDWETFYSDDLIEIQFKYSECDDVQNDMYFSYYLIRLKNKINKRIIVRYVIGQEDNPEQAKSVIIEPLEELTGSCGSNESYLKVFVNDRKNKKVSEKRPFIISKIQTYAL